MSPLVSRGLLLPSVVCAALVLGPVGTAAATVGHHPGAFDTTFAQSSVAGATAADDTEDVGRWLDEVKQLDGTESLDPLLGVLTELNERGAGPLGVEEAARYRKAVETASASVVRELEARAGTVADRTNRAGVRAADPVSDAVAQIQSVVADLVKALTSLDLGSVLSAVTGLLSPVLSLVTGLLGGLPSVPATG
ncbi:hypothetical protein ABZT17_04255 [Streptomyces sp. NPDC005648]|uniref:hypothetical protein n=1 Tax=Streptomyces sp. NPDC005648 TaxID=3157044 RepID=UPI0033AD25BD